MELVSGWQEHGLQVQLCLLIPGVYVLTHSNTVDADGPHHGTAILGSFELIILFFSLITSLGGCSTFVDTGPFVAVTGDGWEQARIILGVCVYASSVR